MFKFIIGFFMGGFVGAAIVLATAKRFQFQGPEDPDADPGEDMQARMEEAMEVGKAAAEEKISELEEMVRQRRGPGAQESAQ